MGEQVKKIEVELEEVIRPNGRLGVMVQSGYIDLINRLRYEAESTSEYNYDEASRDRIVVFSAWRDCKLENAESLLERAVKVMKSLRKKTVTIFL